MADKSNKDLSPSRAKVISFLPFVESERTRRHPVPHSHNNNLGDPPSHGHTDASIARHSEAEKEDKSEPLNERGRAEDEINKAAIEKLLREDNPFNLRRRDSPQGFETPRELDSRENNPLRRHGSSHSFGSQDIESPGRRDSRRQLEARHARRFTHVRHESRLPLELRAFESRARHEPRHESRHDFEAPNEFESPSLRPRSRPFEPRAFEPPARCDPSRTRYADRGISPFDEANRRFSPRALRFTLPHRTSIQDLTRNGRERHGKKTTNNAAHNTASKRDLDEVWEETQGDPHAKRRVINRDKDQGKPHEPKTDVKLCEFSSPCRMNPSPDGMHWRKVVSHIFGRNKASTKLFPDAVWVHYCRKHYQRARYRADQWPFTQCDLIVESLYRMEQWNGVLSFELTLRRREQDRDTGQMPSRNPALTRYLQSGRRHPTAVTAPVPDWLRNELGKNKSFNDIRRIVERVREYMVAMRREEKAQQERRIAIAGPPRRDPGSAVGNGLSSSSGKASRAHPDTYYRHGGWQSVVPPKGATPKYPSTAQMSRVRFPDVEILPTFHPWVWEDDNMRRAEERAMRYRAFETEAMDADREEGAECEAREASDGEDQARADAEFEQMEEEQLAQSERVDVSEYRHDIVAREADRRRRPMEWVTRVSSRGAVKKPGPE